MINVYYKQVFISIYLQKCTVHDKLRTVHFFFVQYYVYSIVFVCTKFILTFP